MSVKYQHPEYTAMMDKWQRCIAVCAGQDAVYDGGSQFLPRLIDQTDTEYQAYLRRTPFYNATWRTLVGLQGMIFRKPAQLIVPDNIAEMFKNVTLSGMNFHVFSLEVVEEALKVGRVGIFTDYPAAPPTATLADANDLKLRPSMHMYKAISIINWKSRTIDNETLLSMVVLKECIDKPVDEFEDKEQIQYRVLDLFPMTMPDGSVDDVYRVRVIEVQVQPDGTEKEVVISSVYPQINGKYLEKIPFQFIGVDDTSWCIDEPPLIDLVDMNLAHFRVSADYEHGCHFTGLPTPVISGYTRNPDIGEDKFNIGSMTAWVFPRPDAKASYLEFTGQGLGALERNLEKKEQYMAVLGARMLESQQTGHVEAADTVALRRGGEQSMLASVAQAVSIGMKEAIIDFCNFASAPIDGIKYALNRDFFPIPMDSLTLTAYVASWQNGAISYDTLFKKLQQADMIDPEKTIEEEQKDIEAYKSPMQIAQEQAAELAKQTATAAPTTPGNVAKKQADSSPKGPKMGNSPATMAPTQTQLQKGTR